ncbi:MAG: ABC transporter permease [Acetobacteraceae bacterium]
MPHQASRIRNNAARQAAEPLQLQSPAAASRSHLLVQFSWLPVSVVAVLVFAFFALANPGFTAAINVASMVRTGAEIAITGFGMMAAIAMASFDLSVGSVAGLAAIVAATALESGHGLIAAIVAALIVGAVCGAINGVLVGYAKISAFVVTLGTFSVFLGVTLLYSGGNAVLITDKAMNYVGSASIGWLPLTGIAALIIAGLWFVLLDHTRLGRAILAIGGNPRATASVGINVPLVQCAVFILVGLSAAISGFFEAATLLTVSPALGQDNFNLLTIAVVVIGGTSLRGGRASIIGTLAGTALIVVLEDGLQVIGLSPLVNGLVVGLVLIVALFASAMRDRYRARSLSGRRIATLT